MVREESHLDDMRAAIRGDFERLAERRGAQELMRESGAEPAEGDPEVDSEATDAPPTSPDDQSEHAPEVHPEAAGPPPTSHDDEPELAPARAGAGEPPEPPSPPRDASEPVAADEPAEHEAPRRSWLARLLGL